MKKNEQRIAFFRELAPKWDEISEFPSEERVKSIVRLAGSPSTVLDAGCGTGVLMPALLNTVGSAGRVVALDPAQEMLAELRRKYPDRRIETRCESLEESRIGSASLDALICFSCFPHVDDKQGALSNAARMLKPSGRLVIAHVSGRDEINDFHRNAAVPVRGDLLPDEAQMRRMLGIAGFSIERFVDEPGRYEVVGIVPCHSRVDAIGIRG